MDIELTIVVSARIVILMACGLLLLKSWLAYNKRFLSDFPFVYALVFFTLVVGKVIDLYIQVNFGPEDYSTAFIMMTKIRYAVMAVTMTGLIGSVLIIWFRSKTRANIGILTSNIAIWALVVMLSADYQSLSMSLTYLVSPVILILTFTFFFTYRQKRLLNKFNSLTVAVGCVITAVAHVIRPSLIRAGTGGWGLGWICEIIDLVAWVFIFWGFFRPPARVQKAQEALRTVTA